MLRSALLPGDVAGRGGGGQHAGRDPPGVEHRGEDKRRPRQSGRAELVGVLDRERPGGKQRGRAAVDLRARRALHPLRELGPVVTAGRPCRHHHRGGLRERDRQPADVLGQVERLDALVGIAGKPRVEIAERLPPAESGHGVRGHPRGRADGAEFLLTQPAGDDDLAGRALRPQAVQVGGGGDAVEHDRPSPLGPLQPGQEPLRGGVGGEFACLGARQQVQVRRRLRVAGHDRGAAASGDPDKQVDGARRPHRVREPDRQLRLAGPADAKHRRDEQDGLTRSKSVRQPEAGFLARVEELGQGRNGPGEDRCRGALTPHFRCTSHTQSGVGGILRSGRYGKSHVAAENAANTESG